MSACSKPTYITSLNSFWNHQAEAQQKDLDLIQKHIKASLRQQNSHLPQQNISYDLSPSLDQQDTDKNDILSKILPAISLAQTLSPWVLTSPYLQLLGYQKISIKLERLSHNGKNKTIKEVAFIKPPQTKIILEIPNPLLEKSTQESERIQNREQTLQQNKCLKLQEKIDVYQDNNLQPIKKLTNNNNEIETFSKSSESKKKKGSSKGKKSSQKSIQKNKSIQVLRQHHIHTDFLKSPTLQKQFSQEKQTPKQSLQVNIAPKRSFKQMMSKSQVLSNNNKDSYSQMSLANSRTRRSNKQKVNYIVDDYLDRVRKRRNLNKDKNDKKSQILNQNQITSQVQHNLNQIEKIILNPSNQTTNKQNCSVQASPLQQNLLEPKKIIFKNHEILPSINSLKQKSQQEYKNAKQTSDGNLKKPRGRPFGWRKPTKFIQQQPKELAKEKELIATVQEKSNSRGRKSLQRKAKQIKNKEIIPPSKILQQQESKKKLNLSKIPNLNQQYKSNTNQKATFNSNEQSNKQHKNQEILDVFKKSEDNDFQKKKQIKKVESITKSIGYPSYQYKQTIQQAIVRTAKQGNKGIRLQDSDDSQQGQDILKSVMQSSSQWKK